MQERSRLQGTVDTFGKLEKHASDLEAALELVKDLPDEDLQRECLELSAVLRKEIGEQEFLRMMGGELDHCSAIVELNGGAGGTEAQDWALMLLRMYTRWAERKGFKVEELDFQPGEEAGIKSATLLVEGGHAYGYLRGEQGVHRLVRISPFDSNARRHTSFASVSLTPDIDQEVQVVIDEKDLRIDTYRSSGAGGQHVNKTDSAVRITHLPTGTVVACQNERSQHKNKSRAMQILKAKLYELEKAKQEERMTEIRGERKKIDFGSQIRSYVLQPYRLAKDLRTGCETSDVMGVLDGEIDPFLEAFLMGVRGENVTDAESSLLAKRGVLRNINTLEVVYRWRGAQAARCCRPRRRPLAFSRSPYEHHRAHSRKNCSTWNVAAVEPPTPIW